jgi:SAM-dependent methyltransferase
MQTEKMEDTIDVQGKALYDYWNGKEDISLLLHNNYGEPEEMPVEVFFRNEQSMPELELFALSLCQGKVLDIGAGAGCHALYLQQNGLAVDALEISGLACEIMRKRGVYNILHHDFFAFESQPYDTLLLLMNGIGLAGTLEGLEFFLLRAKGLINPGGQLLFDSSDITYLYEEGFPKDRYYGEIDYAYEYQKERGRWFKWLYIDPLTLHQLAKKTGWKMQVIYENKDDQYLARLVL